MSTQKQPDPRDERYLKFVISRRSGLSDEKIADKLQFGSPAALYHRLHHDGYPVCMECGQHLRDCGHEDEKESARGNDVEKPKGRKPRAGGGRPRALPPAVGAADLFRKALDKLAREIEDLEHRRETYTGGRFVTTNVYSGGVFISREVVGEDAWRELANNHGAESVEEDELFISDGRLKEPAGGDTFPSWPLPALIAAYLIAGEPLEPLLEALHPAPKKADHGRLRTYINGRKKPDGRDGIEVLSRQVAALVRGAGRSRGTPPPELSPAEQNVASSIAAYRKDGLSDAEIAEKFAHKGITQQDIKRLENFGLSWPQD